MMRARALFGTLSACALAIACGGATATNLFDAPGGSQPEPVDASSGGDADGKPHDTIDASSAPDGHATVDGDIGGGHDDGSTIADGAALEDAAIPDSSVFIDAPVKDDPGVRCGEQNGSTRYCSGSSNSCCYTASPGNPGGGGGSFKCEPSASSACAGLAIECDDDADCKGQICCGTLINNRYQSVRCSITCGNTGTGTFIHFCDPNAAIDVCAADNLQCMPSSVLPGYYRCG
jgi:hypothetical protein